MRGVDASTADTAGRSLSFFSVATRREIAAEMFAISFPVARVISVFKLTWIFTFK